MNGISLYYEELGVGAPILCIHGTGSSSALWRDAATDLATRGRAIVYDRRGFGQSERPEPLLIDVRQQADDAAALIDALWASPAIVIGRSHGGEIAVDLALRHPDRVARAGAARGRRPVPEPGADRVGRRARRADLRRGRARHRHRRRDAAPRRARRRGLGGAARAGPAHLHRERSRDRGRGARRPPRRHRRAARDDRAAGAARRRRDSPAALADATALVGASIPSARVEWVDGGHLIDPAHPAVLAFVDELVAGRNRFPSG